MFYTKRDQLSRKRPRIVHTNQATEASPEIEILPKRGRIAIRLVDVDAACASLGGDWGKPHPGAEEGLEGVPLTPEQSREHGSSKQPSTEELVELLHLLLHQSRDVTRETVPKNERLLC